MDKRYLKALQSAGMCMKCFQRKAEKSGRHVSYCRVCNTTRREARKERNAKHFAV